MSSACGSFAHPLAISELGGGREREAGIDEWGTSSTMLHFRARVKGCSAQGGSYEKKQCCRVNLGMRKGSGIASSRSCLVIP